MIGAIMAALGIAATPVTSLNISIKDVRGDAPEFERVYTVRLDDRATLKITTKVFLNSLMIDGELTQPNGHYVLFEPDEIAEKIIDPTLVPKVRHAVSEIERIDRAWRASKPKQFIDESGTVWVRSK